MTENIQLSKEQIETIKRIYNHSISPHERLNFINIRLRILIEYIALIDINAGQSKFLIQVTQDTIPSFLLHEYLVQELFSFYKNATMLTKDSSIRPKYYPKLEKFRNLIPGHMDHQKKLEKGKDWLNQYNLIFGKIGIKKLLSDFADSIPKYEKKIEKQLIH